MLNEEFSKYVRDIIRNVMIQDWRFIALIVKTIYEKYGKEVLDDLKKVFYDLGVNEAKEFMKNQNILRVIL